MSNHRSSSRPSQEALQGDDSISSQATTSIQKSTTSSQTSLNTHVSAQDFHNGARKGGLTRTGTGGKLVASDLPAMPEVEPTLVPPPLNNGRLSDVMLHGEDDPFAKPSIRISRASDHKACFPFTRLSLDYLT